MKRYLIFMFDTYYPSGGVNDLVGSADTRKKIEEIISKKFEEDGSEIANILNTATGNRTESIIIANSNGHLDEKAIKKLIDRLRINN